MTIQNTRAVSAIKVFGYLEKPVFHELARHLQTRRLVAGDTLDLSQDKSFYIVVDGRVEVFARTPQTASTGPDDYGSDTEVTDDEEEGKGWQLLNSVESGGTLSSLFTILRLFTEEVKLRYEEDKDTAEASSASDDDGAKAANTKHHRERDADVSTFELDGGAIHAARRAARMSLSARDSGGTGAARDDTDDADVEDAARADDTEATLASPFEETEVENDRPYDRGQLDHLDTSIAPSDSRSNATTPASIASPTTGPTSFFSSPPTFPANPSRASSTSSAKKGSRRPGPAPFSTASSQSFPSRPRVPSTFSNVPPVRPGMQSRRSTATTSRTKRRHSTGPQTIAGDTTIARAATDTTLAVIPAEAFRRLTKKFPNAAA